MRLPQATEATFPASVPPNDCQLLHPPWDVSHMRCQHWPSVPLTAADGKETPLVPPRLHPSQRRSGMDSPNRDMWPLPQLQECGASPMLPPRFSQLPQLTLLYDLCQTSAVLAEMAKTSLLPEPQVTVEGSYTTIIP